MKLAVLAAVFAISGGAQTQLTIRQVVEQAVQRYPGVRVSDEQLKAAAEAIALARTAYLPRADVLAQLNRATRNNVFGLLLPQSTLPTISGPPNPENSLTSVWGSAVGFLVTWEPFDFGLRQANVNVAQAGRDHAEAALERSRFDVAVQTADAYLTVLAAQAAQRASEAQRERSRSVGKIVAAQVQADLRPGADDSRARADIAVAETQVIQSEQAVRIARLTLQQFAGSDLAVISDRFSNVPSDLQYLQGIASTPYAKEQRSAVSEAEARRKALDKLWYPRFLLQASSYARGTGANPDGSTGGALSGIGPNIQNWAAGMTVTFPVLEQPSLKIRKRIEDHRVLSESARYDQLLVDLAARRDRAFANLETARRVALQLPVQLEAARAAERQAKARYEAGLANLVEIADAQRLLTQTEIDEALAKLNVWRGLLGVAAADGNLEAFLEQTK
jgi:outer membrane protein TolC